MPLAHSMNKSWVRNALYFPGMLVRAWRRESSLRPGRISPPWRRTTKKWALTLLMEVKKGRTMMNIDWREEWSLLHLGLIISIANCLLNHLSWYHMLYYIYIWYENAKRCFNFMLSPTLATWKHHFKYLTYNCNISTLLKYLLEVDLKSSLTYWTCLYTYHSY